jgi:hypothetical protein
MNFVNTFAAPEYLTKWVSELIARSQSDFAPKKERRFVLPSVDSPISVDAEDHSEEFTLLRISRAISKAMMLHDKAIRAYTDDFRNLHEETASVVSKNSHSWNSFAMPSMHQFFGMYTTGLDMIGGASSKSYTYYLEQSHALLDATLSGNWKNIAEFWEHQVRLLDIVVNQNHAAVNNIAASAGFHFDDTAKYVNIAENSRAVLYQVLPLNGAPVKSKGKPVLHVAPFLLPKDIIALLPEKGMSLVHAFAGEGVPTYVYHSKDIMETPAVQVMTGDDFVSDIRFFAKTLQEKHGQKTTLIGTCQGAYLCLLGCLTGELDSCVDTLIQNVPPNDLTQSRRFKSGMSMVTDTQKSLDEICIRLPNGNRVVSGHPASLSMRLSDFGAENPCSALIRDLRAAERGVTDMGSALQGWLRDIKPMPYEITKISQQGAIVPITSDGVMPVSLFGRVLRLQHLVDHGMKLHVIAGERDEVVELGAALALFTVPCIKNYAGATSHVIRNAGHVAPMTTCTLLTSKNYIGHEGGSLWFHQRSSAKPKSVSS